MNIPEAPVTKADVEFKIHKDGALMGRLLVSNGRLEWRPAHRSKIAISWNDFNQLMIDRSKA